MLVDPSPFGIKPEFDLHIFNECRTADSNAFRPVAFPALVTLGDRILNPSPMLPHKFCIISKPTDSDQDGSVNHRVSARRILDLIVSIHLPLPGMPYYSR